MRAAEGPGRLPHGAASPAALRTRPERRRPRSRLSREPGPATPRPGRDGRRGGTSWDGSRAGSDRERLRSPPYGGRSPPAFRPPENKPGRDTNVAETRGKERGERCSPARGPGPFRPRPARAAGACGPVCSRAAPGEARAHRVLEIIWNTEREKKPHQKNRCDLFRGRILKMSQQRPECRAGLCVRGLGRQQSGESLRREVWHRLCDVALFCPFFICCPAFNLWLMTGKASEILSRVQPRPAEGNAHRGRSCTTTPEPGPVFSVFCRAGPAFIAPTALLPWPSWK